MDKPHLYVKGHILKLAKNGEIVRFMEITEDETDNFVHIKL